MKFVQGTGKPGLRTCVYSNMNRDKIHNFCRKTAVPGMLLILVLLFAGSFFALANMKTPLIICCAIAGLMALVSGTCQILDSCLSYREVVKRPRHEKKEPRRSI